MQATLPNYQLLRTEFPSIMLLLLAAMDSSTQASHYRPGSTWCLKYLPLLPSMEIAGCSAKFVLGLRVHETDCPSAELWGARSGDRRLVLQLNLMHIALQ